MSGSSGGGFRVSIPNNVRKTIQNMKEITRNHSEDEIYAMLKECSMDPNEAIDKLLLQDPFHQVKRKRDRKKEVHIPHNKETASKWTHIHGMGNRGGKANNSFRHIHHDTGGGSSAPVKGNTKSEVADNSKLSTHERKFNAEAPVARAGDVGANEILGTEVKPPASSKTDRAWNTQLGIADKNPSIAFESINDQRKPISTSSNDSVSSAVCFSASDPVLVPSDDGWHHSAVGAIKHEVGSQRSVDPSETASEIVNSLKQEHAKLKESPSQVNESLSPSSVYLSGSTGSRPSSNYSNHSQQSIGSQKAPNKEWKPKQTRIDASSGAAQVTVISSEINAQPHTSIGVNNHEQIISTMQMKLEELHVKGRNNVIIPDHIHVPESERFGLSFGSIDAGFGVSKGNLSGVGCEKNSISFSETSEGGEEPVAEQPLSIQNPATNVEEKDYDGSPHSPMHVSENISSGKTSVSSGANTGFNEAPEVALPHGEEQYLAIQQQLYPSNYYAQFYRPGSDSDGRVSPFAIQEVGAKNNGNLQSSQSQQEVETSPAILVSQARGVMQGLPQQILPIFRPPTGMHLSHYPPNYLPYGHYFSPYYLPGPPALLPFLGNGVFPQQPPPAGAGNMYPTQTPPATSIPASGIKYPFTQYKAAGNSTHIGLPSGHGPYSSSPPPRSQNNNEELQDSQFEEGNAFVAGQQIASHGPDMSNLPANSYYNLPPHPQGQHVAFTGHGPYANLYHFPSQPVSPAAMHQHLQQSQTMAAPDMPGSTGNMYQHSPHPQTNWINNY